MDIFEGSRNERSKLIKASQECFYCNTSTKLISYRKENAGSNYTTNVEVAEQKLPQLETRHNRTAKLLKETKEEVCTLQRRCNNPVTIC